MSQVLSFTNTFELLAESFVDEELYEEISTTINYYIDYEVIARDFRMDCLKSEDNLVA